MHAVLLSFENETNQVPALGDAEGFLSSVIVYFLLVRLLLEKNALNYSLHDLAYVLDQLVRIVLAEVSQEFKVVRVEDLRRHPVQKHNNLRQHRVQSRRQVGITYDCTQSVERL